MISNLNESNIVIDVYECNNCNCLFHHEVGSIFHKRCDNCGSWNVKKIDTI